MKKRIIIISILSILLALSLAGIIYYTCQYIYCFTTEPQPLIWYANHKVFIEIIIFFIIFLIGFVIMLINYIRNNNVYLGSLIGLALFGIFSAYKMINHFIDIFRFTDKLQNIVFMLVWLVFLALSILSTIYIFILKKKSNK